jgi:pimeloyl-ACP methyl ester carboxylesterase
VLASPGGTVGGPRPLEEQASHDRFPHYDRSHPVPRHRRHPFRLPPLRDPGRHTAGLHPALHGQSGNFDPAISDALAAGREIILFDNAGVGRSTGTAPHAIAGMAADAASFIDGLGLRSVDISDRDILVTKHGWSAFYGTDLDLELRRHKVTGIVWPASRPASASSQLPGRRTKEATN